MPKSDSLLLLLLLHVTSCIANGQTNPFDIGAVFDCTLPQGVDAGACTVDYEVPAAVANHRIFAIKQSMVNVSTASTGGESAECKSAINQVQCARQFPRCTSSEGSRVSVVYSSQACAQVQDVCSDDAADKGSCEFTVNATQSTCKTVAQFVAESQMPFSACNKTAQDSNWYVTEWMFAYLRDIDEQLTISYRDGLNQILDKECFERYAQFRCQSIGRCWGDQRQRIEIHPNNIMSNCQDVLNCASNLARTLLSDQLLCHLWPDMQPLSTPTPSITPSTTVGTTDDPINISIVDPTSGTISRHFISLSILLIVTALGACL